MLINDFFNITNKQETEEGLAYDIQLNPDHEIYKGHFQDQPIAPGVCLAQVVKELCENHLGQDLKMLSSRNMKFMAVLDPTVNPGVSVHIKLKEEDEVFTVRAICKNETTSFFKIDAKYSF
jgi:3-hydroxyacyl-[acyl-carrier-protein] dehydratase